MKFRHREASGEVSKNFEPGRKIYPANEIKEHRTFRSHKLLYSALGILATSLLTVGAIASKNEMQRSMRSEKKAKQLLNQEMNRDGFVDHRITWLNPGSDDAIVSLDFDACSVGGVTVTFVNENNTEIVDTEYSIEVSRTGDYTSDVVASLKFSNIEDLGANPCDTLLPVILTQE